MAKFDYKGIASDGQVVAGRLKAGSRDAADAQLRARGLVPLTLEEKKGSRSDVSRLRLWPRRSRVSQIDRLVFTREMSVLLTAGVPLDRALGFVEGVARHGPMARVCAALHAGVAGGATLSEAMREHAELFPEHYTGVVRAGEASGTLGLAFSQLFGMLEKRQELASKLQSALVYPIIVLFLTAISILVLFALVIPEFKPVFARAGQELPLTTQVIVQLSDLTVSYGTSLAAALLVCLLLLMRIRLTESARAARDRLTLAIPVLGPLVRAIETGRFCGMLGTLRASGVPLIDAVRIAADSLQNRAVANGARHVIQPLSQGKGLSRPLADSGFFPDLFVQLIEVGEESGELDAMLLQVADLAEVETDRKLQTLLSVLVPLITVSLGLVVAFVIGSILSAILGSYRLAL